MGRPFYITAEVTLYADSEDAAGDKLRELLGDEPDNVQIMGVVADSDDYYDDAPSPANAKGDVIYAVDEHDREDLPWPVIADHWFWQTGDRWVAVVADWHEDWWEGSDPADIAARPEPWRYPIGETPGRSGWLVFNDAHGSERTLKLTIPDKPTGDDA